MTLINILSLPFLDINYTNVIDFPNLNSQRSYINNIEKLSIEGNIKYDGERTSITVKTDINSINRYDYLYYIDNNGTYYYYFITNKEFNTKDTTTLHLQLDVWMTYQFDFTILDSFVDRCHVDRWTPDGYPYLYTVDEGLEYGDITQTSEPIKICDFKDAIVVAATSPIGKLPTSSTGGGGNEDYNTVPENPTIDGNDKKRIFIHALYPGAAEGYNTDNLFASVTLAMAIEESGWGTSHLAIYAYNYFGQKWVEGAGDYYENPLDGIKYRKYASPEEGAKGLLTFLKDYDRYNDVFNASTPLEQITKIQQAGYNPDPEYITRIMTLINQNNLTVYDRKITEGDSNGYKSFNNDFGNGWLCPVKGGTVSSKYGWRVHPVTGVKTFHHGTDIGVLLNTDYVASKDGIVTKQGYSASMGNYIYIEHDNTYRTRVMHLNEILTKEGQTVKRGDLIGRAGTTGTSTGVHSHWEIRRLSDNESCDPAPSLKVGDKV